MDVTSNQVSTEIWWITKIVVPLAGILIASVIIPLLLHKLRFKREREERLFEARKDAYKEYFKIIESAASEVGQQYEKFSRETMPQAFRKLLDSDSSTEAIVEFEQTVGGFQLKIQDGYRKATEEITGLQIICSEKLLEMTEEYKSKHQEILSKSAAWLGELKHTISHPDLSSPQAKEMQDIAKEIQDLKNNIIRQMRVEIGSDSF